MALTWQQKFDHSKPSHVCVMEKAKLGFPAGAKMLIPSTSAVRDCLFTIPPGETRTPAELRQQLAQEAEADVTCPMVMGIFLRIVAELALEGMKTGSSDVAPFWRAIDPSTPLAKRLSCGPEFVAELRTSEASPS
jgi:hypothetical protein